MNEPLHNLHSNFAFVICRRDSQLACKRELAEYRPGWRFAYSRPGLMTYKSSKDSPLTIDKPFFLKSIFARTYGLSFGVHSGVFPSVWTNFLEDKILPRGSLVHVWRRAEQDDEPAGDDKPARESSSELLGDSSTGDRIRINESAASNEIVIDLIELEQDRWLIGAHRAVTIFQRWPGGKPVFATKMRPISRAYFKTRESIAWSRMPIRRLDVCVEIGAAPGGSVQALLEMGCQVIAVDPADLDERLTDHKNLVHWKRRGREVKKAAFANVRWLFADLNVAPRYTLDTVEDIVTHDRVHVQGMLLTLKLMDGIGHRALLEAAERVKRFGFRYVKLRQLAYNRHEVCLAAMRNKSLRRADSISRRHRKKESLSQSPSETRQGAPKP